MGVKARYRGFLRSNSKGSNSNHSNPMLPPALPVEPEPAAAEDVCSAGAVGAEDAREEALAVGVELAVLLTARALLELVWELSALELASELSVLELDCELPALECDGESSTLELDAESSALELAAE